MKLIIIHQNERTLKKCIREAEKQATVHLVSKKPFAESLRKAFQVMIREGEEWSALIAADQILRPGAMQILEKATKEVDGKIFRVSGYGYDYLLKRDRMLSPCAYRVKYLKHALKIDFADQLQPESFVLRIMKEQGYPFKIIPDNLTVHDSSQYYRDIYRKGRAEAIKLLKYISNNDIIPELINCKIKDHKIFLLGIIDQITGKERTSEEAMELLGLKEKKSI